MMQGRKWPCFIYFNLKFSIDLIPLSQEVVGASHQNDHTPLTKSRNPTSMVIEQKPAPGAASATAAHAMLRMPAYTMSPVVFEMPISMVPPSTTRKGSRPHSTIQQSFSDAASCSLAAKYASNSSGIPSTMPLPYSFCSSRYRKYEQPCGQDPSGTSLASPLDHTRRVWVSTFI